MSVFRLAPAFFFIASVSACGGSKIAPDAPQAGEGDTGEGIAPASSETQTGIEAGDGASATGPAKIPTRCHNGTSPCTAEPKWVRRLCEDVYPAVALFLFSKQAPFTHGYLSRKTRAVNASGGATSGSEWLAFDEEVVLLHYRGANTEGIQVSGANGSYEAMRLDGSCVTLGSDEVREDVPPKPIYADVPWQYIGDDMQDALLKDPAVKEGYIERRTECKGAYSGSVSAKCVQLTTKLNATIVRAVTSGAVELPQPELQP